MRLIKGKDTKPELLVFDILAGSGLKFEPHAKVEGVAVDALVDDRVAVFVDSPFWHLRDARTLERLNPYWQDRLVRNRSRDRRQTRLLRRGGYGVIRVWADEIDIVRLLGTIRRTVTRRLNG